MLIDVDAITFREWAETREHRIERLQAEYDARLGGTVKKGITAKHVVVNGVRYTSCDQAAYETGIPSPGIRKVCAEGRQSGEYRNIFNDRVIFRARWAE